MHRVLLAWTFAFLASTTAFAQDCDPTTDRTGEFVEDINAAAAKRTAALPVGVVTLDELRSALDVIADAGGTVRDFFLLFNDGMGRTVSGEDFRQIMLDYQIRLDFLPTEDLVEIVSDGANVTLEFDFDGDDDKEVEIGGNEYWALTAPGVVELKTTDERDLAVENRFDVMLGPEGIESIEEGDLSVRVAFFWIDLDVRTERDPGQPFVDDDGDPVVLQDEYGQPVQDENGDYVIPTYDDWFVLSAAGEEGRLAMGRLKPRPVPET